jgi:hypothetical protein
MMRAAWYDQQGPAAEVLRVGDLPAPEPGPGEVRVRLHLSGINPGDTKKRIHRFGLGMPFPRVVPHSDGSGVIESAGEGVDAGRVGQRVWVHGAQSYRPFGAAAQLTVVPAEQAVELPEKSATKWARAWAFPGITAPPGGVRRRAGDRHDGARARGTRRRELARCAARALGRRGGHRNRAAQQRRRGGRPNRGHAHRRSTSPTLRVRFVDTPPTAWTASSRLPSRTTSTSMARSPPTTRSSPPTGPARTGRRFRFDRCSGPTSRSACWGATTSPSPRSERRRAH